MQERKSRGIPMKLLTLREIETEVNDLARLIRAPQDGLPTYGYTRDFAYPHIEVDSRGYHYVVVEKGQEQSRNTTADLHELLFWIFERITSGMASQYELEHRIQDRDGRRIAFQKQEELLGLLNPQWAEEERKTHADILKKYPFDDLAGLRADYYGELRKKGLSEEEITKKAYEKYPENNP